ncbi:hypothetical protein G6F43_006012 [Rhizopus delemar]|nr:hypothetical protein G6F43_006012 [Rhizopus delemar]
MTNIEISYQVTVSIDFGTTYSGCCFCLIEDFDDINVVTKWPKCNSFYAKAPSSLYYKNKNGKLLDWGKGARLLSLKPNQDGTLLQYFKLALIQDDIPLPDGKTPVEIISDYLRSFHEYVVEQIQKTKGFQQYQQDEYKYCLTVPAIWPDKAKALMRESAIRAGMINATDPLERLVLISEPEAAAAYCENRYRSLDLRNDDMFMIVDAGGGTVDLVTYLVEDVQSSRTLREVTKGHGGACGSAFIDQNMRHLLESKLGSDAKKMPACVFEIMMDTFVENIKPNYRGDEDQYTIEVPAAALKYIKSRLLNENGQLIFDKNDLEDYVFGPVLSKAVTLVEDQLKKVGRFVNAIFLVGGFGSSFCLYEALKKYIDYGWVGEIAMPPRGELAVAEGAIYYILKPTLVSNKILRRSYGVRTRLPFEENIDPESSAIVTADGIKRCSTRFEAIAIKGDCIEVGERIKRSYWVEYPKHTEGTTMIKQVSPVTDEGVTKLAEFPIRMPLLPDVNPGERIDITVEFLFGVTEIHIVIDIAGVTTENILESIDFYSSTM